MTLQSSGIIKMSEIRSELSETGTVNLGKASWRGLAGKASGAIKMSDFYGKSNGIPVTYLIVGGGGGGGTSTAGGGGGAGGVAAGSGQAPLTTLPIVVGLGGAASTDGGSSSFNSIVAAGGQAGFTAGAYQGATGGSSGSPQSYAGGAAVGGSYNERGGGGGGAGGVGGNYTDSSGGTGGAGYTSSITGTSMTFAGGGGGGAVWSYTGGLGTAGGGNGNHVGGYTQAPTNGSTWGAGGGGGGAGGTGANGVVVVSYDSTTPKFSGGTLTSYSGGTSGTIWVHKFTGSGSLTPGGIAVVFVPAAGTGGVLTVDETVNTTVSFNTFGASNGTVLYWTIENGTTVDSDWTAMSGSFTINSNTGSFTLKGTTDATTEGNETFTLHIRTGSTSGTIVSSVAGTLVDSSVTPGSTPVVPTYTNGNMTGTLTSSGSTYNLTGWTAQASIVYLQPAGGYGPTTISGWPTPTDSTMPSPYVYPIAPVSGYSYFVETSTDVPSGFPAGTQSLRLWAQGQVPQGYGIVYGPYLTSDSAASLAVNDKAIFWWRAAGGSDAYNIYAYLLEINTGATIELLNATGQNAAAATAWAKVEQTINTAGTYRFVFLSGTWDQTGGQALGASLYITGISIYKP